MISRSRQLISRMAGSLLLAAARLRDCACHEVVREEFGSIDPTSAIEYPLKIKGARYIHLAAGVKIASRGWLYAVTKYRRAVFNPEIRIGEDTSIGGSCHIVAANRITIGKRVKLGDGAYLSDNLHGYCDIHRPIVENELTVCGEVKIGDDCRIGRNVCIIGDVEVGEHCRVSANAVVRRNLPPFCVAAGIPARVVKRYNPSSQKWEPTDSDGHFRPKARVARASANRSFPLHPPPCGKAPSPMVGKQR